MVEPEFEEQLLGLSAKGKIVVGSAVGLFGIVATAMLWDAGFVGGSMAFTAILGPVVAVGGVRDLRRQRLFEAEIERAKSEWEQLRIDLFTARRDGQNVARHLQARGYRDFHVRRWIAAELDPGPIVPIDLQFEFFAKLGIVCNPGVTTEDLEDHSPFDECERRPFGCLAEVLAAEIQREPFTPIADRLWLCDVECIEGPGSYVRVLQRLARMVGGELPISSIEDHVDQPESGHGGVAWVRFRCRGELCHWGLGVDEDWLDTDVLIQFAELLERSGSDLRLFANTSDYSQEVFLAVLTPEHRREFVTRTRIELEAMA
ncbi:MAG: hypothetical protein NXI31_19865 [bacterium]|nr:hypothetical protein [bacterium]